MSALTIAGAVLVPLAVAVALFADRIAMLLRGPGTHCAPVRLIPSTLIPRRPRAAGGATGHAPMAGAPAEVPASDGAPVRPSGTGRLWPGGPVTAPAGSRRRDGQQSARAPQPPDAAPEGVTAPASPGAAARQPWVRHEPPPGTQRRQPASAPVSLVVLPGGEVWDGRHVQPLAPRTVPQDGAAARDRQTGAQPALVRPGRERHERQWDRAVNTP